MKASDSLANIYFQKNGRGNVIFYPLSIYASGRIVPPNEIERLKKKVANLHLYVMAAIFPFAFLFVNAPTLQSLLIFSATLCVVWIGYS